MGVLQHFLEFILAKRHKEQRLAEIIFAKFNAAKINATKFNFAKISCPKVTFVTQGSI